jgi:hypothetical protein
MRLPEVSNEDLERRLIDVEIPAQAGAVYASRWRYPPAAPEAHR